MLAGTKLDARAQEGPMKTGRRFFISSFAVGLTGMSALLARAQRRGAPVRIPQGSENPGTMPDGGPLSPQPAAADPIPQLKESQKNLRKDVDHLLELAQKLKEEADKTEQTDVLSLSLIKKSEEIEKLAHHIKDLVRSA
jgi:hypothetical protein